MASKRKPYIREMPADWWRKHPFYRFYMLREGTAVFAVWVSLLLIYGLAGREGFFELLSNPIVVLLNIAALAAALLHTKTWFDLAPKAVNVPEKCHVMIKRGLWGASIVASGILLVLAVAA